jgi:hypothetical protein
MDIKLDLNEAQRQSVTARMIEPVNGTLIYRLVLENLTETQRLTLLAQLQSVESVVETLNQTTSEGKIVIGVGNKPLTDDRGDVYGLSDLGVVTKNGAPTAWHGTQLVWLKYHRSLLVQGVSGTWYLCDRDDGTALSISSTV